MAGCSAPGKLILFGEHAVVFGEPALATAVDLRAEVYTRRHPRWKADGGSLDHPRYAYVKAAVAASGASEPQWIEVRSAVPEGSGLGSSAAVSVATLGALHGDAFDPAHIARQAFEVEFAVQGRASPIDTTTATAGGAVLVLPEPAEDPLWIIERGDRRWVLHRRTLPPMRLVVGVTGVVAPTGPLVAKVRERVEADPEAAELVREIGELTIEGLRALEKGDLSSGGELMDRNHALLNALGVGHPLLEKLVTAARPTSHGAKLTGAGGGGSMIALSEAPEATAKDIRSAGGRAFVVGTELRGAVVLG